MKIAHIYASNAKKNSGDYMIGIAYKQYFKEIILKTNDVTFTDYDCRNSQLYNDANIEKINNYDYILVGGGGLILPDTNPNKISCWQWNISKTNIEKITKPIYVLSIGYNLFFNQTICMPNNNSKEDHNITPIFIDNITTLINKSVRFTLRHNDDVEKLIEIIGENYRNKISYEMCETVWYAEKYMKPRMNLENKKYIGIEIKDDREWRRYYKIGKSNFYKIMLDLVKKCINENKPILYLSHDGSDNFYKFLKKNNINIPLLMNNCANESLIIKNFSNIHTLYCTAGHSQMIAYGLGIKIISLVTHPKIKNFCHDIKDNNFIEVNKDGEMSKLLV
tara:strand:+ start:677 stop:1681 length:1005 start_codon:yes stop_codon:yes gene_type:complete